MSEEEEWGKVLAGLAKELGEWRAALREIKEKDAAEALRQVGVERAVRTTAQKDHREWLEDLQGRVERLEARSELFQDALG